MIDQQTTSRCRGAGPDQRQRDGELTAPPPGPDDSPSELRKPRGRRGPKRPGASRAPNKAARPPPGLCRVRVWTWGVWKLQRARPVRVVAELPSVTGPPAAAPSDLAPSAGSGWPGLKERREQQTIRPCSRPRAREPPSRRKTAPSGRGAGAPGCPRGRVAAQPGGRGGARSAQARGGAGTWEGAERSGVGAQGPVAHPRHELQAEDRSHLSVTTEIYGILETLSTKRNVNAVWRHSWTRLVCFCLFPYFSPNSLFKSYSNLLKN